jgi:hypothetical protein
MMMPIGRRRSCKGRSNPRLAALLGFLSGMMLLGATVIERHDGEHWPVAVAMVVAFGLIGLGLLRVFAVNRDNRGK